MSSDTFDLLHIGFDGYISDKLSEYKTDPNTLQQSEHQDYFTIYKCIIDEISQQTWEICLKAQNQLVSTE